MLKVILELNTPCNTLLGIQFAKIQETENIEVSILTIGLLIISLNFIHINQC